MPGKTFVTNIAAAAALTLLCAAAHAKPDIFLLKTYDGSQDVRGWVMSEKLDGVRGIWNGAQLISRGGNILRAPKWFTRGFPPFALDGELWTKRGDFENIVSIVRAQTPDARWRRVTYQVFEAPHQRGGLRQRLAVPADYLAAHPHAHIKIVRMRPVRAAADVRAFLAEITEAGGEGVVVRDPRAPYQTGRLASALKVKQHFDAECEVKKILPGKGKYRGMMGALQCEMASGRQLKIGTGFTDKMRATPPQPGAIVTFKYYGRTASGAPRFPVYLRRR
ncbi:MAG: DNA ligase [Gammaproteobacteria bacterium]